MYQIGENRRGTPRLRRRLATALAGLVAATGTAVLTAPVDATTVTYQGATTGTQSSIVIHQGDQYERTLHPTGTITAELDDTTKSILSSSVAMDSSYTPTFVGPFGLKVYVKTDLEQVGGISGSVADSGTVGIVNLSANATNRLRLTVYREMNGVQNPATDPKLTDPAKCWVDLSLALTGQANRRTGDLHLEATGFEIPKFPNGNPDPTRTCGLATNALNTQVAGTSNRIDLNFSGGPTSAHYTGVIDSAASTIVIKKGDLLLQRIVHPEGSLVADIDFTTNTVSNTVATFKPITMSALPNPLSSLPLSARVDMTPTGAPAVTIAPSGTVGIDKVSATVSARMAVTLFVTGFPNWKITDGAKCYVNLTLKLNGTVDRGTNELKLATPAFTIPTFPSGCGWIGKAALDLALSGSKNAATVVYRDGVVS